MSQLYKVLSIVLLVALVASGLAHFRAESQLGKARLEAAQARSEADGYQALAAAEKRAHEAAVALHARESKVLTERARKAEQLAADQKEQSRVLAKALRANSGWADSPIPAGVLNAIKTAPVRRND